MDVKELKRGGGARDATRGRREALAVPGSGAVSYDLGHQRSTSWSKMLAKISFCRNLLSFSSLPTRELLSSFRAPSYLLEDFSNFTF